MSPLSTLIYIMSRLYNYFSSNVKWVFISWLDLARFFSFLILFLKYQRRASQQKLTQGVAKCVSNFGRKKTPVKKTSNTTTRILAVFQCRLEKASEMMVESCQTFWSDFSF